MRRRALILTLGGAGLAFPFGVQAQRTPLPIIGFLHGGSLGPAAAYVEAFRLGLTDRGYIIGQNVAIEYRWAESRTDSLPALAAELVELGVDVILAAAGTPPVLAAKAATATIPIVFPNVGDPVGQGLVASLARPGGNLTGISILFPDLTAKRIELLAELVPKDRVIGLIVNPANPTNEVTIGDAPTAARAKGLRLSIQYVSNDDEIDAAFAEFARQRIRALLVGADPFFSQRRGKFVALAAHHAILAVYAWREFVAEGGLLSYGPNAAGQYRQAALLVAKILGGAKPADLPVEQPTNFELVINLNTAKALGLAVPQSLLARADEVID